MVKSIAPTSNNLYYESKHGRVVIFNGENYADWVLDVNVVLAVAGATPYVNDELQETAESTADQCKAVSEGIKILYNSVSHSFK